MEDVLSVRPYVASNVGTVYLVPVSSLYGETMTSHDLPIEEIKRILQEDKGAGHKCVFDGEYHLGGSPYGKFWMYCRVCLRWEP
jgi:hypothetical protein